MWVQWGERQAEGGGGSGGNDNVVEHTLHVCGAMHHAETIQGLGE